LRYFLSDAIVGSPMPRSDKVPMCEPSQGLMGSKA